MMTLIRYDLAGDLTRYILPNGHYVEWQRGNGTLEVSLWDPRPDAPPVFMGMYPRLPEACQVFYPPKTFKRVEIAMVNNGKGHYYPAPWPLTWCSAGQTAAASAPVEGRPPEWDSWGPGKKAAWTRRANQNGAAAPVKAPKPAPAPVEGRPEGWETWGAGKKAAWTRRQNRSAA